MLSQEVLCSEHQCPHQATVVELKRKLDLQQKKIRKLEQQLESVLGEHVIMRSAKLFLVAGVSFEW